MDVINLSHADIKETTSFVEIAEKYAPHGWEKLFKDCISEFKLLDRILESKKRIYPRRQDVFAIFYALRPENIQCVIMGQDPYPSDVKGVPQACGFSFATRKDCPLQGSVRNIYKEIKRDYPSFCAPDHGYFIGWVAQGVFALNACLTVDAHSAGSHKNIWKGFLSKTLSYIYEKNPDVIYLLWGTSAIDLRGLLNSKTVSLLAGHPSPLAYTRGSKLAKPFEGCGHFREVNTLLTASGKPGIDWSFIS